MNHRACKPKKMQEKSCRRKLRKESYGKYIHKVLKTVNGSMSISCRAMGVMNNFVHDTFERFAIEAARLSNFNKQSTMLSRDIRTAVKLMLPGKLGEHALNDANKAMAKYDKSLCSE